MLKFGYPRGECIWMTKCKYCEKQIKWNWSENGGWHAAESDGSWHACPGSKYLEPDVVSSIQKSVTVSEMWIADKFIKRLAEYCYLYPRAVISPVPFLSGDLNARLYLIRCSDPQFRKAMRASRGKMSPV